jgi:ectoine hydroxylase-related dioxygenase (phytanoyl-CoA dioxygenase family)
VWPLSDADDPFARNELGDELPDGFECVPLEVPAGAVVFFGPLLVHRSEPNRSGRERRALLYSYQPPGRRTQLEVFRRNFPLRGVT